MMKKKLLIALTLLLSYTMVSKASKADEWKIPLADAKGRVGALMPYTRYDSETAALGGGATLKTSPTWDRKNIASQASRQSYVDLPTNGAYAEWTMRGDANGVTLRFTMPDSPDGMGLNGSLDVYVNDKKVQTVNLTSYYMYQYFAGGNPADKNDGGTACFAFDETHFLLNKALRAGDRIRIQSSGANGYDYGVDFIETEVVPDEIECPAGAVNVTDAKYRKYVKGNDYLKAFEEALKDADAGSKILYIPAGTFELSSIWYIFASDVTITGAGMWYTNLKFTNPNPFGGGISGGNGSHGRDGYCSNVEICNLYLNSNLRSRHNQQAVYKCFMDVFKDGSVIHHVWEDHFECGFWIGDYNGAVDYSNGLKIVDCRIRNNFADGVNFCQGTSNATVYNCSVRNNGDDGLAMWNDHTMGAVDEKNNTFAYNTIELIWRAGGIALYGGDGHKIYNNYLADMCMASGIHLNDVFSGPKYTNTQKISFDNNILVRCGTNDDSWHEDLAAIDIKGGVRNVVFNNTKIYDSPFDAIRVMSGPSGIEFKNTEILGASLAGQTTKYSTWEHSTGAIRLDVDGVKFSNGIKIANVGEDKIKNNQTWPVWTDNNKARAAAIGYEYLSDATYKVPDFPEADTSQQGGIVNPLEGIKGYDVDLQGLRWENTDGSTSLKEGDAVTFKFALTNVSNVDIPAGVNLGVKVTVDGQESFVTTSYKKGLKAKQTIILTTQTAWKAVAGGHVVKAEADYRNRLTDELTRDNNNREKKFNVAENEDDGDYTPVTGGYDLVVTKVAFDKKTINPGDEVRFTATIVNAGDRDVPAGTKLGVQFQIDGNTSVITWNDKHYGGLKSHQKITLSATGGTNGKSTWTATNGVHTLTAWVNDTHDYRDEVNGSDDANKKSIELKIPLGAVRFFSASEVSSPDDLNNLNQANAIDRVKGRTEAEGAYYDLQGNKVATTKENLKPGLYIHNGKKIIVR